MVRMAQGWMTLVRMAQGRMVMLAQDGHPSYGAGWFLVWDGCDDGAYLQTPHAIVLKKMISTTPYHDLVY